MSGTLNEMIERAISGGLSDVGEYLPPESPTPAVAESVAAVATEELDKTAAALEFISTKGVASLLEKEAGAPELASNEAAASFTQKAMSQREKPKLDALLSHKAYADSTLKELLSHTGSDKNLSKGSPSLSDIKAELRRRKEAGNA